MKLLWLTVTILLFSSNSHADELPVAISLGTQMQQDQTSHSTIEPSIAEIEHLYAAKKFAELKPLLVALHGQTPTHLAVYFLSGTLAAQEGDYPKAIDEFRAMLTRDPNLIRPRLELASALQKNGDRQSAKYHYEQVLSANLPNEVRSNIYQLLSDIRERLPSVQFSLDIVSDSNPKQATNNRVIMIGGLPYTLNDSSKAKTVYGTAMSADVHWPLASDPTWFAHAYGEINEYPRKDLDSMYGQATLGKRFDWGQNNISTEIGGHVSSYQNHKQYDGWQVRGTGFIRASPKLGVTSDLSYKTYNYDNLPYLNGDMKSINLTGIYVPQATQRLEIGTGFSHYSAHEEAYSYNQPLVSARFMQEWQGGWLTGMRLQALMVDYAAPDPFFGEKRRDAEKRVEFDVLNRKLKLWSFSPKLLLGYVERNSNLELYSYKRMYARIGVSMQF